MIPFGTIALIPTLTLRLLLTLTLTLAQVWPKSDPSVYYTQTPTSSITISSDAINPNYSPNPHRRPFQPDLESAERARDQPRPALKRQVKAHTPRQER